jgi:hypothetical protein
VHHDSPALCTQVVPLLQGAHVPLHRDPHRGGHADQQPNTPSGALHSHFHFVTYEHCVFTQRKRSAENLCMQPGLRPTFESENACMTSPSQRIPELTLLSRHVLHYHTLVSRPGASAHSAASWRPAWRLLKQLTHLHSHSHGRAHRAAGWSPGSVFNRVTSPTFDGAGAAMTFHGTDPSVYETCHATLSGWKPGTTAVSLALALPRA